MVSPSKQLAESLLKGEGLYTLSDAAFYARIPRQTLQAWFFGRGENSYRSAKFNHLEDKLLTFNEFVEALAVRSLREKGFPLQSIFQALQAGELLAGASHPVTNPEFRMLADLKGKHLYLMKRTDQNPYQVSGKKGVGQMALQPVVQEYLKDIEFNRENQAIAYRPPIRTANYNIVLMPRSGFGEPLVEQLGYPARVLAQAVQDEGSIDKAAYAYNVDQEAIKLARKYIEYLQEPIEWKAA
jgi:uncharacterized protein (DUF433 family)